MQPLPGVALESTILRHGLPYPPPGAPAKEVEGLVRSHGAIPATIALLDGTITVGLSTEQIERLGTAKAGEIVKCSRRDLAPVIAQGKSASTTVASTMCVHFAVTLQFSVTCVDGLWLRAG